MRRSTSTPLVATVVLGSVLAIGVLWFMASLEFGQWEHRGRIQSLPAISQYFRSVYRFGWSLPAAAIAIGGFILLGRERDVRFVSWYFGVVAVLTVAWTAFGVLALYLMYASTNHQL
jgi:hypothetical protein